MHRTRVTSIVGRGVGLFWVKSGPDSIKAHLSWGLRVAKGTCYEKSLEKTVPGKRNSERPVWGLGRATLRRLLLGANGRSSLWTLVGVWIVNGVQWGAFRRCWAGMKCGLSNILRIIDYWVENGLTDTLSGSQEDQPGDDMVCVTAWNLISEAASAHMENWEESSHMEKRKGETLGHQR